MGGDDHGWKKTKKKRKKKKKKKKKKKNCFGVATFTVTAAVDLCCLQAWRHHSSRTMWHDMIGKHCPVFGVKDIDIHPNICQQFWNPQHWPKHILEKQSEIDVTPGFYVLFGSGELMSFVLSIYILQSSRDKLAGFVRQSVAESSGPAGGVARVE